MTRLTGGNIPAVEVYGRKYRHHTYISYNLRPVCDGDKSLVNNTQYYFMAIAYAYNEYMKYSDDPCAQFNPIVKKGGLQVGRDRIAGTETAIPGRKERQQGDRR